MAIITGTATILSNTKVVNMQTGAITYGARWVLYSDTA